MSQANLDILIYQKRSDPPAVAEDSGSFWINLETGAFFVSKEETDDSGTVSYSWFKEGQISESQFRQFFDDYSPLATDAELDAGEKTTRVSITPKLLKDAIAAMIPDELDQEGFDAFLNNVSPLATRAEAEGGLSERR